MTTNLQKYRVTKQIRIAIEWHKFLKLEAFNKGLTISRLIDEIVANHFQNQTEPANEAKITKEI